MSDIEMFYRILEENRDVLIRLKNRPVMKDKRQMVTLEKYEELRRVYDNNLNAFAGMEKQLAMTIRDRDMYRERVEALEKELQQRKKWWKYIFRRKK